MNKVKPQAGMMFKCKSKGLSVPDGYGVMINTNEKGDLYIDDTLAGSFLVSERFINDNFEFIPANDLEWLAVNISIWRYDDVEFIKLDPGDGLKLKHEIYSNNDLAAYGREEWQETRYRLGVEERPVKDDGKLKLTEGDEYTLKDGDTAVAVYQSDEETCMKLTSGDCKNSLFTVSNKDGKTCDREVHYWDVVKRHNPYEWMGELPSPEVFADHMQFIACDEDGLWYSFEYAPILGKQVWSNKGLNYELSALKMPKLTGDQWKNSKCKIVDNEWVRV